MRSISAKQIDLLKIIFLRPISGRKPLGINVDVFIAYWQMKIPECVVGGASVIELAKLVSLDSNDFYHCDLRSLLHTVAMTWQNGELHVKNTLTE